MLESKEFSRVKKVIFSNANVTFINLHIISHFFLPLLPSSIYFLWVSVSKQKHLSARSRNSSYKRFLQFDNFHVGSSDKEVPGMFQTTECFLMPEPGKSVKNDRPAFTGQLTISCFVFSCQLQTKRWLQRVNITEAEGLLKNGFSGCTT